MNSIALSQGQVVLLDDEDFARLSPFHWCYRGERDGNPGYAIRHVKVGRQTKTEYLHRAIMQPPDGHEVIFLNYDRLDCRRANLRVVTKQEARLHHRVRSDCKSGIKGVRFNEKTRTWSPLIYRDSQGYSLGRFRSPDSATAYRERYLAEQNPELYEAPARIERSAELRAEPQEVEQ